jgi:hypothetical protein
VGHDRSIRVGIIRSLGCFALSHEFPISAERSRAVFLVASFSMGASYPWSGAPRSSRPLHPCVPHFFALPKMAALGYRLRIECKATLPRQLYRSSRSLPPNMSKRFLA